MTVVALNFHVFCQNCRQVVSRILEDDEKQTRSFSEPMPPIIGLDEKQSRQWKWVGGYRSHSEFFFWNRRKIALNQYWYFGAVRTMCILLVYSLLTIVSYYDLSVCQWWVSKMVGILFNFAKPLKPTGCILLVRGVGLRPATVMPPAGLVAALTTLRVRGSAVGRPMWWLRATAIAATLRRSVRRLLDAQQRVRFCERNIVVAFFTLYISIIILFRQNFATYIFRIETRLMVPNWEACFSGLTEFIFTFVMCKSVLKKKCVHCFFKNNCYQNNESISIFWNLQLWLVLFQDIIL